MRLPVGVVPLTGAVGADHDRSVDSLQINLALLAAHLAETGRSASGHCLDADRPVSQS